VDGLITSSSATPFSRSRYGTNLPIKRICIMKLTKVERAALSDELDVARFRCGVVERDNHHVRQIYARQLDIQHARRRLDLRLQPVRRPTEHHHRACKLEDKLLPREDLCDMPSDLAPLSSTHWS